MKGPGPGLACIASSAIRRNQDSRRESAIAARSSSPAGLSPPPSSGAKTSGDAVGSATASGTGPNGKCICGDDRLAMTAGTLQAETESRGDSIVKNNKIGATNKRADAPARRGLWMKSSNTFSRMRCSLAAHASTFGQLPTAAVLPKPERPGVRLFVELWGALAHSIEAVRSGTTNAWCRGARRARLTDCTISARASGEKVRIGIPHQNIDSTVVETDFFQLVRSKFDLKS